MLRVRKLRTVHRRTAVGAVVVCAALASGYAGYGTGSAAPAIGLPVNVLAIDAGVTHDVYSGVDYGAGDGARPIHTTFTVVQRTGNCCENYLATTPGGMLLDFGGNYVNYSQDHGETWLQAQPLTPMGLQSEGAIVTAPDGDVLGVGWDLAIADYMLAFKYDVHTGQWTYMQIPFHAPYYDREWMGVVPGPVTIAGTTYPWVSFIKERLDRNWLYSTDGLNYLPIPAPDVLTGHATGTAVKSGPLPITPDPSLDWVQPNANTGITPLGGGRALAAPGLPDELNSGAALPYSLLDGGSTSWSPYAFPGTDGWVPGAGRFQVDSAGRIHNVLATPDGKGFVYRISTDGGATWQSQTVALPAGFTMNNDGIAAFGGPGVAQWDFRANLAAGVAAVGIRADNASTGLNQDLLYKFDITGDQAKLTRMWQLGLGDIGAGQGAFDMGTRMDFGSLAIFPDGRVAMSFLDSTTHWTSPGTTSDPYEPVRAPARGATVAPAIAIEDDTEFGPAPQPASITLTASPDTVRPSPQPGDTSQITATVLDADGNPVVGAPVNFSFKSAASGAYPTFPTLTPRVATTDAQGKATVTYTGGPLVSVPQAPEFPQVDVIDAQVENAHATITMVVTAT